MTLDWTKLGADLERLLKLRAIPFGMKLFENRHDMEAIPRIRRPKSVHTLDQVVAQAARLGWSVVGESACADSWGRALDASAELCRYRALPSAVTAAGSTTKC
jgi:uncharacterized protein (DUF169 family)